MFDIITFGSASWDIFVKSKNISAKKDKKFLSGKGVCFDLGSKIDVEDFSVFSGGGGTNAAATFKNQGLETAYCGMVGEDMGGSTIIEELKSRGVDTSLIFRTKEKLTNHSIVFNVSGDRTIFVYRGASENLAKNEISWDKLKAKWLYIAPLSGKLCRVFSDLIDFAHKNKIKVAINPGNCQLALPAAELKQDLAKIDILILNQEEASLLTKIPYKREADIFKKIDDMCSGIAVMTKGEDGVSVSDGKNIYKAEPLKVKIADKTGAGDAFGSGFVSEFISSHNIESAIQFGAANASSCIEKFGAKNGLLKKGQDFQKIKVSKELCSLNGLCQAKR